MRNSVIDNNASDLSNRKLPNALTLFIVSALFVLGIAGCGGGGGGGDDSSGDNTDGSGLSTDACGDIGLKIFTGTSCSGSERSAVVQITTLFTNGATALCSGTLITSTQVLTAGHCFPGGSAAVRAIVVSAAGAQIEANDLQIHPGYFEDEANQAIFNDAAVVQVSSPIGIAPIPLGTSRAVASGDVIDIFGYGLDEGGANGTLKSGQMLVSNVTANHIVAVYGNEGSNTCSGDSGGPAIQLLNGTAAVVGITSSGSAAAACQIGDVSLFAYILDSSLLQFVLTVVPGAAQV